MDKTTIILAVAVFGAAFTGAMLLLPPDGHRAAPPHAAQAPAAALTPPALTPKEQAEMAELAADPKGLSDQQKDRIEERRQLVRDYPLSIIDAAEVDGKLPAESYRVAVANPPPGFWNLDAWQDTQTACVAWQNENGTVHETYVFKPGFISHSGLTSLIGWVRSGCAEAVAKHGQVVNQHGMLQDLYSRIPSGNDYAESRAGVMARLKAPGPVHPFTLGVQYFD